MLHCFEVLAGLNVIYKDNKTMFKLLYCHLMNSFLNDYLSQGVKRPDTHTTQSSWWTYILVEVTLFFSSLKLLLDSNHFINKYLKPHYTFPSLSSCSFLLSVHEIEWQPPLFAKEKQIQLLTLQVLNANI